MVHLCLNFLMVPSNQDFIFSHYIILVMYRIIENDGMMGVH